MMKGDQAWTDSQGPKVGVMSVSLSHSCCLSLCLLLFIIIVSLSIAISLPVLTIFFGLRRALTISVPSFWHAL